MSVGIGRTGFHIWADRVEATAGEHRGLRDRTTAMVRTPALPEATVVGALPPF
jgi:hypothetical protein